MCKAAGAVALVDDNVSYCVQVRARFYGLQ